MARKSQGHSIKKRKINDSLFSARAKMKKRSRYSRDVSFFRPKLMVDEASGKVYASPLSGGSYTVNPRSKIMKRRRRKAVAMYRGNPRRRKAYKRNPSRRKSVRRYRRNPGGSMVKQMFNKKHLISIVSMGVGFVGGIKAQKYINALDALASYRRFTGIIPFLLGTVLAMKSKKDAIKSVGAGLSLSGLYDLVTQNIPQIGLSPVEGVDLEDNGYYGTAIDVNGTVIDMEGADDIQVVGEEMFDNGSPYAVV